MSRKPPEYQPGLILLDALVGAFRAHGTTFEAWCRETKVPPMTLRIAALGGSQSETSRRYLERAIDAAGRDFVLKVYRSRLF